MRKPAKPRKPEEPTYENLVKKLAKEQRIRFKKTPSFQEVLNELPKYARDPSLVRLVRLDTHHYGYTGNGPVFVTIKVGPEPGLIEQALEKSKVTYDEKIVAFNKKWKAYEKKLMEWKEWKYSKVMKEINEA